MLGRSWDVFQPLLFGLIGAEIVIADLNPVTVGKNQNQNQNQLETTPGSAGGSP